MTELEEMKLRAAERSYLKSVCKDFKHLRNPYSVEDELADSFKSLGLVPRVVCFS